MTMDTNSMFGILFTIFCFELHPTIGISVNKFISVPHVPGATTVSSVSFVSEKGQCANKCLLHGSCQGFLMVATEVHPCQLLIGLDGSRAESDPNIEAFVSLYYNGLSHVLRTSIQSWKMGLAFCQSMGKTMVGFPMSGDKKNWMIALSPRRQFIKARKNPADNTFYDIDTNITLEVDWHGIEEETHKDILTLLQHGTYLSANVDYAWHNVYTVICAPVN